MAHAVVTLVTNDQYVLGALVLAASLKETNTTAALVCMVTDKVSSALLALLRETFDEVVTVDELNSHDTVSLELLCRPELGITFTKLFAWKLTQYEKCLFLDADTLVIQSVDELFEREELSAAPDVGWADLFNSGVFVMKPSLETFDKLIKFAAANGSFDGGDQGLLNDFFADWATADIKKHLPFTYNLNANASYFYAPAYRRFKDKIKILHFIGPGKPWMWARDRDGRVLERSEATFRQEHVEMWWAVHDRHFANKLSGEHYSEVGPHTEFYTQWHGGEAYHNTSGRDPKWDFGAIEQRLNELISHKPYSNVGSVVKQ